jgi:alginate O-acetyltransferase complex protein AlgJ
MGDDAVHQGLDGWLFLSGGTNSVLGFYTAHDRFPDSTPHAWIDLLRERRARCASLGATYVHLIVPERLTIYPELYLGELPYMEQCPSLKLPRLARELGPAPGRIAFR